MAFILANKGWPNLDWNAGEVTPGLVRARHKQGLLLGRMRQLGFALQAEAAVEVLTSDVVQSSAIEGERLDQADVRSSIARRLGLPDGLLDGLEGFLTTSKYASIARCSADTALRDISDLVERGVLVRNAAGGRSTSYRVAD